MEKHPTHDKHAHSRHDEPDEVEVVKPARAAPVAAAPPVKASVDTLATEAKSKPAREASAFLFTGIADLLTTAVQQSLHDGATATELAPITFQIDLIRARASDFAAAIVQTN